MSGVLLIVGAALYGLAIGSFLNVVIARVPAHRPVSRPPSACPQCAVPIQRRDNIPVVSWVVLRGRCRACRAPISARYPLVEILTAGLFVEVVLRFGWSWSLPAELALVAGLVALAFCDLDHLVLPKRIVYPDSRCWCRPGWCSRPPCKGAGDDWASPWPAPRSSSRCCSPSP